MAVRLEHVIARNSVELREERGWTQADLARHMSASGLGWTPNRCAQVETLRGRLSVVEVLALAWTYEVPLVRLLAGDDLIDLPGPGRTVSLEQLRQSIDGKGQQSARDAEAEERTEREELRKVAQRLGVGVQVLQSMAIERYGKTFGQERDDRAGDMSGRSKRSAAVKRGHATRSLLAELSDHLDALGRDEVIRRHNERVMSVLEARGPGRRSE